MSRVRCGLTLVNHKAPSLCAAQGGAILTTTLDDLLSYSKAGSFIFDKPLHLSSRRMPATTAETAEQLRSGYAHIRVDVASMRRLRVTKGIYLPSDTPMHGIFGSKDVIHS